MTTATSTAPDPNEGLLTASELRHIAVTVALAGLTDREREIAISAARGLTNREVAEYHSIALSTVKSHIHWTLRHLKLQSRRELSILLMSHGTIEDVAGCRALPLISLLTPQQIRVLMALDAESRNREFTSARDSHKWVGLRLGLSPSAIKAHMLTIRERLGVSSHSEMIAAYRDLSRV